MGMSNSCNHAKVSLKKVPEYPTMDLGISLCLINAAEHEICDACGEVVGDIHIPNPSGLVAAAAVYRASLPKKLSGKEIRFIRRALEMPSKILAGHLNLTPETISRCENDKMAMNPTAEKIFRILAVSCLESAAPAMSFDVQEIVKMKISAVFDSKKLTMKFGIVKLKTQPHKKLTEAYSEAA